MASIQPRDWWTARQLAELTLPGLPTVTANIIAKAKRENWQHPAHQGVWWRERSGSGGGIEYSIHVLPGAAQAKLAMDSAPVAPADIDMAPPSDTERAQMWAHFERLTEKKQNVAKSRLVILQDIRRMIRAGVPSTIAMTRAADKAGQSRGAIYQWQAMVRGIPERDWLPFLAPRHAGRAGQRVDFSEQAWDALRADWMRPSQPTIEACYRRIVDDGAALGWVIPSIKTCARRLQAIPEAQRVLAREGMDALKQLYPAQRRDRSSLHAMQVLNADFHTWDVRVQWPDGTINRPSMAAFQDIYSGKVLAWRIDHNPTRDGVRLCFGEVMDRFGIPSDMILDNGREFAAKELTGGQKTRHRFKIRDEDPEGLFTQLGIRVHWTNVYSGQSKPIERAFRDFAGDIAKHPHFEGAYVGKNTVSKPSNYASKAIPLALFTRVVADGIAEHNARLGRSGGVCRGRSFDAVFAESYAGATIARGTAEQRRLWLLAADSVMCSRKDGTINLLDNRFWAEELTSYRGQRVTVRFDPMNLHAGVHVYRADGAYLVEAPCVADVGFLSRDDAREQARKTKTYRNSVKAIEQLQARMSLQQRTALLAKVPEADPLPEPQVVRPIWGNTARKPVPQAELEEQSPAEAAMVLAISARPRPRLVTDAGDD